MKSIALLVIYLNIFSILSPSWGHSNYNNQPESATGLSPRQENIVRETWGIIREDPLSSGKAVLLEYLKRYPSYQELFTSVRNVPYQYLTDNLAFQNLSRVVIDSLSSMVDSLDDPPTLMNILLDLGKGHIKLGVTKKQYVELKDTIIDVLGKALGRRWDNEVSTTWEATLDAINSVIFKTYA